MADKKDKVAENVSGEFYVDGQCIACALCVNQAVDNFKMKSDESYAYVYKQPENDQEYQECKDAMESCPADAIGDDGEE